MVEGNTIVSTCSGKCGIRIVPTYWALISYKDGLLRVRCINIDICKKDCFLLVKNKY